MELFNLNLRPYKLEYKEFDDVYWDDQVPLPKCLVGAICIVQAIDSQAVGPDDDVFCVLTEVLKSLCQGREAAMLKGSERSWVIDYSNIYELLELDVIKERIEKFTALLNSDEAGRDLAVEVFNQAIFPDDRGKLNEKNSSIVIMEVGEVTLKPKGIEFIAYLGNAWLDKFEPKKAVEEKPSTCAMEGQSELATTI